MGSTADYWIEREFRAMGSHTHLTVGDADAALINWAVREIERLEQSWSRFRPDSELNTLNAHPGEWFDVSAALFRALEHAQELFTVTSGVFDPTVLDALEHLGYDRTFDAVDPARNDAPEPVPAPGFAAVELDPDKSAVFMPEGTRIDLGGIGKGLAADLVAQGLVDRGARTALVSMGGDIRAAGESPEGGWNIPVSDPFDDALVAFAFPLVDGAIVTSTTRMRSWQRAGTRYHHLIDPASGDSARTGIAAVVAHARTAWWSEGIAKAALIAGRDAAASLAQRTGVRLWCWLDDGSCVEFGA